MTLALTGRVRANEREVVVRLGVLLVLGLHQAQHPQCPRQVPATGPDHDRKQRQCGGCGHLPLLGRCPQRGRGPVVGHVDLALWQVDASDEQFEIPRAPPLTTLGVWCRPGQSGVILERSCDGVCDLPNIVEAANRE